MKDEVSNTEVHSIVLWRSIYLSKLLPRLLILYPGVLAGLGAYGLRVRGMNAESACPALPPAIGSSVRIARRKTPEERM